MLKSLRSVLKTSLTHSEQDEKTQKSGVLKAGIARIIGGFCGQSCAIATAFRRPFKSRLDKMAASWNTKANGSSLSKILKPFWRPDGPAPGVLKKLLKALLYSLSTCIILLTILLSFALDNSPQPRIHQGMTRDDIQRAKQLLHVLPEDRDRIKTVSLNQKDLNIAASYLLSHFVENTTLIRILNDRIVFQIAVFVPKNPWGQYLDFSFSLRQTAGTIWIKSFKIGEISIPDRAANRLFPLIVRHTPLNQYWQAVSEYIKNVQITPQTLDVSYLGSIVNTAKQLAIKKHRNYPNLYLYQQQINEIVTRHDPEWRLSLSDLLQPLFLSAYQRSDEDTAIQENRAVIIAVASYVYKNELRRYLPLGLVYSKEYPVYAYRRIDIPQHFIASALLSAVDSSPLSEQLGVDKEVGDAQQGSGFSFIDLTADRSGTRFGRMAVASPRQARDLQHSMSRIKHYSAIIPDIQGLPEHMDEQTFRLQYDSIDSPGYRQMIEEIDSRIAALPLYQAH